MPHLSPMNWIIVPTFMIMTLLSMMVIMWWQFLPSFPFAGSATKSSTMTKLWKWW